MRYIWQHIEQIIKEYKGNTPLAIYLKNYFRQHPILGSRDRKTLSEMAYSWYRCSKGMNETLSFETKMQCCLFLTGNNSKLISPFIPQEWGYNENLSRNEKLNILNSQNKPGIVPGNNIHTNNTVFRLQHIFDADVQMSMKLDKYDWMQSMLTQPDLFIRVRSHKKEIIEALTNENITFKWINDTCLALPNGTSLEKCLKPSWYVIQDLSSQTTGNFFKPVDGDVWWDCCSGAGGKSLLLKDINPSVKLVVSDIRESIISNLRERFKQYHLELPSSYILDAGDKYELSNKMGHNRFNNIICDVPCSGSGTWGRTPEQMYFFNPHSISEYALQQKEIACNAAAYLLPGGTMYYITCSVFAAENENVVEHLLSKRSFTLEHKELITGINNKADSLFIAVLKREEPTALKS
ncbi:MAG: RsmB/NOP family class I SAM-dependent RNA methyltransferase [Bacteroidetes bacterium]|nr:RsmB/NOP family class I SAM-dependent RNA methyltransferase [Bacteroidota bacterium]